MNVRCLTTLLACFAFCGRSLAQVDEPQIRLSLNENLNLVLTSDGFSTSGIDIQSGSGSLVPLPPGDLLADPTPFQILLANNRNQITLGGFGGSTTIDGEITLRARWDAGGERDIDFFYGNGATPVGPFQVNPADYDQCPDCLPQIDVGLTEDLRFRLTGVGQKLDRFSLNSPSGSLIPNESPAPFASFGSNTSKQIDFDATTSPVVLDGDVILNVGWNDYIGGRDVRYVYETAADGAQGPLQLDLNDYPPRPFVPQQLNAYVNANDKLVVTGSGHTLRRLSFMSAGGSLVPSPDAGPFVSLGANASDRIDYLSPARGGEVILDGSLQLGAGWDPSKPRDIRFDYAIAGDARDEGLFQIPAVNYLDSGSNLQHVQRPQQQPRFHVTLNEDAQFVVSSDGRSLQSLQFFSSNGSLIPAESPAPFQLSLVNDESAVWYQSFGEEVVIDGEVVLTSGWNGKSPDVAFTYFSRNASGLAFDLPATAYEGCRTCPVPRIDVSLDDDYQFVLTGSGQSLKDLQISSPRENALLPATNPAPFSSLNENSPSRIAFGSASSEGVTLDGSITLSAGYDLRASNLDVEVSYALADQDRQENFRLPLSAYPSVPRHPNLSVRVDDNNQFVIAGSGQPLIGFTLTSQADALVPGESAAPFQELGDNTSSRIEFSSPDSHVTIDGEITLDAGWNPIRSRQVQYEYTLLERSRRVSRRSLARSDFPTQFIAVSDLLQVELDDDKSIVLVGENVTTSGIDLHSPSGSLIPGTDASPFEFFLAQTSNQVTLGTLGDAVTIDGRVTLDVKWDETGSPDIRYFFGQGAENTGPFDILPSEYASGSCFNCDGDFTVDPPVDPPVGPPVNPPVDSGFDLGVSVSLQGEVVDGFVVIRTDGPVAVAGIDLQSPAGRLVPVPDETGATPFTFFLSNTSIQITWGTLGSTVVIDGTFATSAGYTGDPTGDLVASWGNGASPVAFNVTPANVSGGGVELDVSQDLSDVTLDITDRQSLAIRGTGQSISQLAVSSPSAGLVPNSNTQNAAGPFATLEELSVESGQLLLFSTGGSVTLDGVLDLGVNWHEDIDGPRDEFSLTLFTDVSAQVTTPDGTVAEIDFYQPVSHGVTVRLNEQGLLVLEGAGQGVSAINITSTSGSLVTDTLGDLSSNAAGPFSVLLANNANQVTFANFGATVTLDEIMLPIGVDAQDLFSSDLVIEIGIGAETLRLELGTQFLPEPSGLGSLMFGTLAIAGMFRSRRRCQKHEKSVACASVVLLSEQMVNQAVQNSSSDVLVG